MRETNHLGSFTERAETIALAIRSAYLPGMFERVKRGVLFVLSLAAFLVQAWPEHARACSCLDTSFDQARADSAAIFEGRVVGLEPDGADTLVHFRVTQSWRGVEHEEIALRMPTGSAACAFHSPSTLSSPEASRVCSMNIVSSPADISSILNVCSANKL